MKITLLLLINIVGMLHLPAQPKSITVAQDGNGDYTTVQAAFNAIPAGNKTPVTIHVKKGIYQERIVLDSTKDFVTLTGDDKNNTILTYNNHTGQRLADGSIINTYTSASFFVYANNFTAGNITFRNDAGFDAGQAVAVLINGDKVAFRNCNFTGFQDVLFCNGARTRQYYEDCYIEGTTDFIFGAATAVFQNCHIHSKKNSHVTAASTPADISFGFVFFHCQLTADNGVDKVSLGRPWRPYASVTYIRCRIGSHILPEGWNNWKNPANEATARFAEYQNEGPGATTAGRVSWAKQLTGEEVKKYTLANILGNWTP